MLVLTEQEWFDNYYPKEWGDYTKEYNIKKYREQPRQTACTWMCYGEFGYPLAEDEMGLMKVVPWTNEYNSKRYFISCSEDDGFIQPYRQPKDGKHFFMAALSKTESNLNLYNIYVAGCDDSSYRKDFLGYHHAKEGLEELMSKGVKVVLKGGSGWYFTN